MTSEMNGLSLFEALSQLHQQRQSGRLKVSHWDRKEGVIGLNDGIIAHCHYGKIRGMQAFNVLRNWLSITLHFFENVESLSVDIEEDTEAILASLGDQTEEIASIRQLIPTAEAVFALSQDSPDARISLNSKLWAVVSLVNGRNSVKDICLSLRANEFSISKVLHFLHGRKIIRMVAAEQPIESRPRDAFFDEMESILVQYIGPITPTVIEDTLSDMAKSREYVTRSDLPLLVERIAENLDDEKERIDFQTKMLPLIQGISAEEA